MPYKANEDSKKVDAVQNKVVNKTTEGKEAAAKKTVSKATGGKRKNSKKKKLQKRIPWWCKPVVVVMLLILTTAGVIISKEMRGYENFKMMRQTVSFEGFYPGIVVEGVDVGGRQLSEVLLNLRAHEETLRQQHNLSLTLEDKVWNITAEDIGYYTDYEQIVRTAYQMGREGSVKERYDAIGALNHTGANFSISRGYDEARLRSLIDQIAAELSYDAVDAAVSEFDLNSQSFKFTNSSEGKYVDAEKLYQSALVALQTGNGTQMIAISQETIQPSVTKAELEQSFGKITEARTNASNSNRNRLTNIRLALDTLNGVCIRPGETFSFNSVVGQRTTERGYKSAGAFVDGMVSEEVGGGICQVSTTLFNAAVKSNLEIVERQPHSRPVGYVDKGKDAAVSWPSQDFKFTNNTDYPVYIVTNMGEDDKRCVVSIYGHKLENGMSIIVEAEVTEVLQPEDPRYMYTSSLPTGQKELVEEAREGYRATAYKIYLDANGNEMRREVLCYSKYAASGAVYRVGQ